MKKRALITGITGQDGSYLAELLLNKGYDVHGIVRRASTFNTKRIDHIYQDKHHKDQKLFLHHGDLTDGANLIHILSESEPHEIYNLGAMSHVKVSFGQAEYTSNVIALGTIRILEAMRILKLKDTKFYQASSSEMYGNIKSKIINEQTSFDPRSPYASAKVFAFYSTKNYRNAYNLFASNGIAFNHESPRRGETFVTRKISQGVAKIALGLQDKLYLGNLNAQRDWGHAKDYVQAMWQILQHETPEDWIIATGVNTSVRNFLTEAFNVLGVQISFVGEHLEEKAFVERTQNPEFLFHVGQEVMSVDKRYFRPTEANKLIGDASKIKKTLDWGPTYQWKDLCREMVLTDLEYFQNQNTRPLGAIST